MEATSHRVVIKLGTGLLTEDGGTGLDVRQFRRLTYEIADLIHHGIQCIIVSSGAVGAGLMALGLTERPKDLASIQACAAIGQSRLMRLYGSLFGRRGLLVAQVLLTHFDIDSRTRYANAKNTIERLLASRRVVPIINENDTVAVEELRFGDNDRLSAEVARLVHADLLILLTSANGLTQDGNPEGEPIREVKDVESVAHLASAERGQFSVGGMASKLQAVKIAVDSGITAVIAHGRKPGVLPRVVSGEPVGTRFRPQVHDS
jgi:glutamate 5-kinase